MAPPPPARELPAPSTVVPAPLPPPRPHAGDDVRVAYLKALAWGQAQTLKLAQAALAYSAIVARYAAPKAPSEAP